MAFSLSNIFGGGAPTAPVAPAAPVAPTVTTTPGNLPVVDGAPTVANPGAAPNGVVPTPAAGDPATPPGVDTPAISPATTSPDDPLASLTGLWDTDPNAQSTQEPALDINPAELQKVIAKGNFAGNVTPEVMQRIEAGGQEAVAATMEAMNSVAQNVMLQATLASNKMVEQSVARALAQQATALPGLIKKHTLSENLVDNNPMLSDPRIQPVAEMLQNQLQLKNPTATSQQLTEMTSKALSAMSQHFTGNATPPNSPNTPQGELDWDQWALDSRPTT